MDGRMLREQFSGHQIGGDPSLKHRADHQALILRQATIRQGHLSQQHIWHFELLVEALQSVPPGCPAGHIGAHRLAMLAGKHSTFFGTCAIQFSGLLFFPGLQVAIQGFQQGCRTS